MDRQAGNQALLNRVMEMDWVERHEWVDNILAHYAWRQRQIERRRFAARLPPDVFLDGTSTSRPPLVGVAIVLRDRRRLQMTLPQMFEMQRRRRFMPY